jgi:hypothetical protein
VNGELESFMPWSGALLTPSIDLMVGQMLPTDANYNFQGVIDDIRIYNYALSYPQVQILYQSTSAVRQGSDGQLPQQTALLQNYPNPFNPTTEIRYEILGIRDQGLGTRVQGLGVSNVRLVVYDILGREVEVLVNERKAPGSYSVTWDAGKAASGVYIIRLRTDSFTDQMKMVLAK